MLRKGLFTTHRTRLDRVEILMKVSWEPDATYKEVSEAILDAMKKSFQELDHKII